MPLTSTQKTASVWALVALAGALLLWLLAPVLTPFVVAAIFAYALTPAVDRLHALGKGRVARVLAVLLVESVFLLSLLGVLLLMVPILAKELPQMREQVPLLLEGVNASLKPVLNSLGIHATLDVASIRAFLLKYLNSNFEDMLASAINSLRLGGSVALTVIGNAVLIPVALFYLLMEWAEFMRRLAALVPPRLRRASDGFVREADLVLGQYLRGQLLVMVILAIYYSLALALFGLDLAIPIGVFTGLAIFVPYLGFGIGLMLATLGGMLQFSSVPGPAYAAMMVAAVYGAGQLIEGFFLTPRLVGKRIGLHPLAVIFALLAFGQLLGLVGVLVALPVSAVLLVVIRRTRHAYLASRLYRG
jgi:predicted PurR-regulated permease PerM